MSKKALIYGITGQDGSYLAELLLAKGYEVHGIIRRASNLNTQRIDHVYENKNLSLHYGDVTDALSVTNIIRDVMPDEIYNLAAQSFVKASFEIPAYTAQVDGVGTLNILEAMRQFAPDARFYQASTSELYGKVMEIPQTEETPFYPRSPYGVAKLYGYWITKNYREAYDLHVSNGILFNHESPRRGNTFVTQKIVNGVFDVMDEKGPIELGNLNSKRDWGYAPEYVYGMWLMLQQGTPDDYVIATNETTTIREFVDLCFAYFGIDIRWEGEGEDEVGYLGDTDKIAVVVNPKYYRPTEVELLIGNPKKIETSLGWRPSVDVANLAGIMMMNHNISPSKETIYKEILEID